MIARRWEQLNAHPRTRDAVVAATWLMLGLAALQLAGIRLWADFAPFHTDGTVYLVALVAIAGVATMRSTRPFLSLGLGSCIAAVDLAFGGSLGVVLILSDLIYAAVKYGSDRGLRAALWTALATAALLTAGLLLFAPHSATVPTVAVQFGLIIFISAAWGWAVRSERTRTRAALVQAHARNTTEMRERIAHDLHDLVANHIAVAGLHIEAAKLRLEHDATRDSAAIRSSLERAKLGTDAAHRELRALIEVLTATLDLENAGLDALEHGGGGQGLGESGAPEVEGPRDATQLAAELEALARILPEGRELRWRGDSFERAQTGIAATPPATQIALMRALRELVANVAKHGSGDADVAIEARTAAVGARLTISNQPAAGGTVAQGSGLGLRSAGMILRLVGGNLDSGPVGAGPADPYSAWGATITLPTDETVGIVQPERHA